MAELITAEEQEKVFGFFETKPTPEQDAAYYAIAAMLADVRPRMSDQLYAHLMHAATNVTALALATGSNERMVGDVRAMPLADLADVCRLLATVLDRVREHVNADPA